MGWWTKSRRNKEASSFCDARVTKMPTGMVEDDDDDNHDNDDDDDDIDDDDDNHDNDDYDDL